MKLAIASIFLLLSSMTSTALAGGFSFDCSNADGSIRISEQGFKTQVFGSSYVSLVKLSDLDIWSYPEASEAQVEVISAGKRVVLRSFSDSSCRDISDLAFTEKVKIRDMKSKAVIAEAILLCENSSATTTGGRDCSAD